MDHPHSSWPKRSRAHGDEGAALVEFALVMPLLFLLLFGIVEFGINLNDYQAIRQGARDAARTAVVADYGIDSCAPSPSNAANNSAAIACSTRSAAGLSNLKVRVLFTDLNGGTNFSSDRVKVCAAIPAKSTTGLLKPFLQSVYLKTRVEMRAEKNLTLSDYTTDVDPTGSNWSWC